MPSEGPGLGQGYGQDYTECIHWYFYDFQISLGKLGFTDEGIERAADGEEPEDA